MAQEISRAEAKRQEKMASKISVAIIAIAVVIAAGFFVKNTVRENKFNKLIESVPENSVVLSSGIYLPKDENLENVVINMIKSDGYTKKDKKDIIELLALQGLDTTKFVEAYNEAVKGKDIKVEDMEEVLAENTDTSNDGINDNYSVSEQEPIIDFLKTSGIIPEEAEIEVADQGDTGLNMLGGKSAKSYRNLYEAEKGFGTRLGLFFTVGCLENYEMVAAYTVGDEFLQCVYAVNQDGTALTEEQDIEASDINTLTVKLSMTKESDELLKVYNEYDLYSTENLVTNEEYEVDFYGTDEKIHLIAFDMPNTRSYVIHTASGIPIEIARALVYELDDGITYVDLIEYEEPTYE